MLKYLADVLSGRIGHWTETNNVVVTELWNRAERLGAPYDEILKQFTVSAGLIADALFLRHKGSNSPVHGNPKKLTVEQFQQLYSVLLAYFVFIYRANNPAQSEQIRGALLNVVTDHKLADDIHAGCVLQSLSDKEAKFDLARASNWVWGQVTKLAQAGDSQSLEQWVWFGIFAGELYKSAINRIMSERQTSRSRI